jgi:hypothetical protein
MLSGFDLSIQPMATLVIVRIFRNGVNISKLKSTDSVGCFSKDREVP